MSVEGQQTINNDLVWNRLMFHWQINEKWTLNQEVEERFLLDPARHNVLLVRTRGLYRLNKNMQAGLGLSYAHVAVREDPEGEVINRVNEIRPQIEFAHSIQIKPELKLQNRYWVEFRFTEQLNTSMDYRFTRFRYMLLLEYKMKSKPLAFGLFDEVFLIAWNRVNDQVFDHNRVGAYVTWSINDSISLQPEYIFWYQEVGAAYNQIFNNIYRLTFNYYLK